MTGLAGQLRFVGEAFKAFGTITDDVEVIVKIVNSRGEVLHHLRSGQIDLAVVQGDVGEPGLVAERIRTFDSLVVMPSDHPLSERADVSVADLAAYPILSFSRELDTVAFDKIVAACVAAGAQPRIVQEIPMETVRLALVAANMGISIASTSIHERPHPEGLCFRRFVGIDFDTGLYLVRRKSSDGPAVQLLAKTIGDAAERAQRVADRG